jgi:hypothetical protein
MTSARTRQWGPRVLKFTVGEQSGRRRSPAGGAVVQVANLLVTRRRENDSALELLLLLGRPTVPHRAHREHKEEWPHATNHPRTEAAGRRREAGAGTAEGLIRAGYVYRNGDEYLLTDMGREALAQLGVYPGADAPPAPGPNARAYGNRQGFPGRAYWPIRRTQLSGTKAAQCFCPF